MGSHNGIWITLGLLGAAGTVIGAATFGYMVGRDELEDTQGDLSRIEEQLSDAHQENDNLSRQVEELHAQLTVAEGNLSDALEVNEELSSQVAELQAQLVNFEEGDLSVALEVTEEPDPRTPTRLEVELHAVDYRACSTGTANWTLDAARVGATRYPDSMRCSLDEGGVAWREYELAGNYNRFTALVGVDDESRFPGETIEFTVWSIDRDAAEDPLAAVTLTTGEMAEIEADVSEVDQLRIVVEKTTHLAESPRTASSIAVWAEATVRPRD